MSDHTTATNPVFISLGSGAWSHLKVEADRQMATWYQVGRALQVGKSLSPTSEAFDQWCCDNGYRDMVPEHREALLALMDHWEDIKQETMLTGMSHPLCYASIIKQLKERSES